MIRAVNITKRYHLDGAEVDALGGVSFTMNKGSFTALMGPSGSGKSTLMNILGLLDTPSSGDYFLDDQNVACLKDDQLSDIRNRQIGFVFQSHNLLPRNTILENVCLPLYYRGDPGPREKAVAALKKVGLERRLEHFPGQISGGESQRTAIARAIVGGPKLILADEPTGNLDSKTGVQIIELLKELNESGVTLIVVTHDPDIAAHARNVIRIRDGMIERQEIFAR
ncbi:ABC-type antimicrobial peptide transport system, ATPase component [hydrothermal vent metagenome]|uniref:ABC-type antimicrobial peptide transport system, ATPase component n=1 Tax=hydrothermal vent metagenome TaxID=652676 RepID=A0A3B1C6A0_9ZZZZ